MAHAAKQTRHENILELDGANSKIFLRFRFPLSLLCASKGKLRGLFCKGQRLFVRILEEGEVIEKHAIAKMLANMLSLPGSA